MLRFHNPLEYSSVAAAVAAIAAIAAIGATRVAGSGNDLARGQTGGSDSDHNKGETFTGNGGGSGDVGVDDGATDGWSAAASWRNHGSYWVSNCSWKIVSQYQMKIEAKTLRNTNLGTQT